MHYPSPDDPRRRPAAFETIGIHAHISSRLEAGRPVLQWQRPSRGEVDKGRRLLATGRYADEEAEYQRRMAPMFSVLDPKRGFPQPMRRVTRAKARARARARANLPAVSAAGVEGGGGAVAGKKRKRASGARKTKL
jgi:hypothetical protein